MIVVRVVLFAAGLGVVVRTVLSALLTFVLPRAVTDRITRFVFIRMRAVFVLLSLNRRSYLERDALWALFAPISLLVLTVVWVLLVIGGFTLMFWAVGVEGWQEAFTLSGSSLLTLGFAPPATMRQTILSFAEAGIRLGLIAVLISFLPTIYGAWSRREGLVTTLETRAGSPPMPAELFVRFHRLQRMDRLNELFVRFHRLQRMDRLNDLWTQWEVWFADVEESHTSLASLPLFRSSHPERSWVVSAGWRVNYDVVLRSLAGLTLAPPVAWSGDRAIRYPFSRF